MHSALISAHAAVHDCPGPATTGCTSADRSSAVGLAFTFPVATCPTGHCSSQAGFKYLSVQHSKGEEGGGGGANGFGDFAALRSKEFLATESLFVTHSSVEEKRNGEKQRTCKQVILIRAKILARGDVGRSHPTATIRRDSYSRRVVFTQYSFIHKCRVVVRSQRNFNIFTARLRVDSKIFRRTETGNKSTAYSLLDTDGNVIESARVSTVLYALKIQEKTIT